MLGRAQGAGTGSGCWDGLGALGMGLAVLSMGLGVLVTGSGCWDKLRVLGTGSGCWGRAWGAEDRLGGAGTG